MVHNCNFVLNVELDDNNNYKIKMYILEARCAPQEDYGIVNVLKSYYIG